MLAEDGSGKGAGLVSAIAQRINARFAVDDNTNVVVATAAKNHKVVDYHRVNEKLMHTTNVRNGFHNDITSAINGHSNGYSNGH